MAKEGNVFRKTSVSNTGPSATTLSDPSLQAASFSRQGVVDQSGLFKGQAKAAGLEGIAGAISGVGETALDLDKRFALLDLEKQVQSEAIAPFIESRQPGFAQSQQQAFEDASIDNFELEQRGNALRETMGEGAAIEQLDPEFAAVTKRLENAKRQGAISEDELQLRIKALTRAAIAKRPGLMNELTAHAQNTLGLSGAQEQARMIDQLGQAEAAQEAKVRSQIVSSLTSIGIPHDPINEPTEALLAKRNRAFEKRNAFEAIQNDNELQKEISSRSTTEILESGLIPDIIIGGFDISATNMANFFTADMAPNDFKDAKLKAQAELLSFQAKIDRNPNFLRVAGDPAIKKTRDDWVKNLENLNATLQSAANGADALEVIQNDLSTIRSLDERGLHNTTSPATINLLKGLGADFPILRQDVNLRKPMEDLFRAVAEGGVKSSALADGYKRTLDAKRGNFASVFGTDGIMKSTIPSTEDNIEASRVKDPQEYQERFDTVFKFLENETDINKKNGAIGDLVKEMGKPEMRNFYDNLPLQTQDQFLELLEQQTALVTNSIDDVFKKAEDNNIDIRTRMVEGRLRFTSEDTSPKARDFIRRENLRVATGHQEVIQAFAVRFNKPFAETSTMLQKVFTSGSQDRAKLMDVLDELQQGIQEKQESLSENRQSRVGSTNFIANLVQAESGGNPEAKAPTSNAVGLTQFIPSTWNKMVDKFNPGLREGRSDEEVLALRTDPELSKEMAGKLAEDNARILENSGVQVDDVALHLSHLLGVGTASNVLQASPNTNLSDIVGAAAIKANRNIMEGKKVKDLVAWSEGKMGI